MQESLTRGLQYVTSLKPLDLGNAAEYLDTGCTQVFRPIQVLFPVAILAHAAAKLPAQDRTMHNDFFAAVVQFLQSQSDGRFSFNYWIRGSNSDLTLPLPDDADDAACALAALSLNGVALDPEFFLKLLPLETRQGGPYRTWYIDPQTDTRNLWGDVDVVVNAHIMYFCAVEEIKLANTRRYLLQQIQRDNYSSQYYPYAMTGLYYAAKYAAAAKDRMMEQVLVEKLATQQWDLLAPMERVQYLLAQSYLRQPVSNEQIESLLSLQQADGSFPAWPMCFGFERPGKVPTYVGSQINSTALMLELLALQIPDTSAQPASPAQDSQLVQEAVVKYKELGLLKIFSVEEIAGSRALNLPLQYAQAIVPELTDAQQALVHDYSLALSYGWASYTLLDKMLDREISLGYMTTMLSLQRLSQKYLRSAIEVDPKIESAITEAYAEADRYYKWELKHARFDADNLAKLLSVQWNYQYIGRRMQPFVVAMSWLPRILGQDARPGLDSFWKSLAIIDQINDDAHDYNQDYADGIMTYVLWNICHRSPDVTAHDVTFWNEVMPIVLADAQHEYRRASRAIHGAPGHVFLTRLLDLSIAPIMTADREARDIKKLTAHFRKTPD